jgi:hypothetical protein
LGSCIAAESWILLNESIVKILDGEQGENPAEAECQNIPKFKYAPITSVNVERSFLAYKLILGEKRHKSESENIEDSCNSLCS